MDARGKSKPRGFINAHGSSCYMSVILQILFYNETFREGINTKQRGKSAQILSDLQKVFNLLAVSTSRSVNLENFKALFLFPAGSQEDPLEYLKKLLTSLAEHHKSLTPLINSEFVGSYTQTTRFRKCDFDNTTITLPCDFMSVVIKEAEVNSLEDGLSSYLQSLDFVTNAWCSKCKRDHERVNEVKLQRLSRYLLVQVIATVDEKGRKTYTPLYFNDRIDMSEHLSEEKGTSIYALKGGIDHLGRKISSGHYVLNIKVGGEWLVFNDTKVTSDLNFGKRNIRASTSVQSKELGDFISKDAYVLIYEKYSLSEFQSSDFKSEAAVSLRSLPSSSQLKAEACSTISDIISDSDASSDYLPSSSKTVSYQESETCSTDFDSSFDRFVSHPSTSKSVSSEDPTPKAQKALSEKGRCAATVVIEWHKEGRKTLKEVPVFENDTVYDFQLKIMEVYDIPPNEQLLLLDGIDLTMLDQSLLLHKMLDEKDFVRLERAHEDKISTAELEDNSTYLSDVENL